MIASIWDLFHWGDKYLHTTYLHKTWRNPTADIYWSGALAVWQSVRITTVTKYNKRCSQAWFMSSAQGGRREIRQAEIVTRVWPHRNQSDDLLSIHNLKKMGGKVIMLTCDMACARSHAQKNKLLLSCSDFPGITLISWLASALHQTGSSKSKGRF